MGQFVRELPHLIFRSQVPVNAVTGQLSGNRTNQAVGLKLCKFL